MFYKSHTLEHYTKSEKYIKSHYEDIRHNRKELNQLPPYSQCMTALTIENFKIMGCIEYEFTHKKHLENIGRVTAPILVKSYIRNKIKPSLEIFLSLKPRVHFNFIGFIPKII